MGSRAEPTTRDGIKYWVTFLKAGICLCVGIYCAGVGLTVGLGLRVLLNVELTGGFSVV